MRRNKVDINRMIDSHREMIDAMSASLRERGFDKALLGRPVELQEERATGIKTRIEALENARRDYVAKVDVNIKTLKSELSALEARIKSQRQNLAMLTKTSGKRTAAEPATNASRPAPAKAASKAAPTAVAKRAAKSPSAKATAKRPKGTTRKNG